MTYDIQLTDEMLSPLDISVVTLWFSFLYINLCTPVSFVWIFQNYSLQGFIKVGGGGAGIPPPPFRILSC